MTAAIFDFATIAKHARLKALDGSPQNTVQPMAVEASGEVFDGYGMYLRDTWSKLDPKIFDPVRKFNGVDYEWVVFDEATAVLSADLATHGVAFAEFRDGSLNPIELSNVYADTAPAEYSAPVEDGA